MADKLCGKCQLILPVDSFHIRRASKDGLASCCKSCQSAYDKARCNLPHRIEARQRYQKTPAYEESSSKAKRRYQERNPSIRKAHIMVGNFLRDGKLTKPVTCECCRDEKRLYAHHCDYTKPLEVMWLCDSCHKQWHRNNQPVYSLSPESVSIPKDHQ